MEKISILINSKEDFEKIKNLIPECIFEWNDVFLTRPTSVVFKDKRNSVFGVGSTGCAKYQKENGFKIINTEMNEVILS